MEQTTEETIKLQNLTKSLSHGPKFLVSAALIFSVLLGWALIPNSPLVLTVIIFAIVLFSSFLDSNEKPFRFASLNIYSKVAIASLLGLAFWIVCLQAMAISTSNFMWSTAFISFGILVPVAYLLSRSIFSDFSRKKTIYGSSTVLSFSFWLWALAAIFDSMTAPFGTPLRFANHERFFVFVFLLANSKYVVHTKLFRLVLVIGLFMSVFKYQSLTSLAAIVLCVMYFFAYKGSVLVRKSFLLAITISAIFVTTNWTVTSMIYEYLDRQDNTSTRIFLWDQAIQVLDRSPLFGGAAQLPTSVFFKQGGMEFLYPLHNTWLTLGLLGGWVAVVLFASTILFTLINRPFSEFSTSWFPAILAGVVTLTVNPILEKPDTALIFWMVSVFACLSSSEEKVKQDTVVSK